jgi:rhodanese-related sulfurtransferase
MRITLIAFFIFATTLMAEYVAQPIDQKLIDSKIKIIDIRTPGEWKETGMIKGSLPIMFFDEEGNYNVETFLGKLNKAVKKGEKFALICNSGSRTQVVGNFLGKQQGYNVIDLQGGIQYAISRKFPLEPYKPKP